MFDIIAKKSSSGLWTLALQRDTNSSDLAVSADTKTDAVVAMRERINEWLKDLKEVCDELDAI